MLSLTLAFNCTINCTLQYNFLTYFLKCNHVCGKKLSVFWWQNLFLLLLYSNIYQQYRHLFHLPSCCPCFITAFTRVQDPEIQQHPFCSSITHWCPEVHLILCLQLVMMTDSQLADCLKWCLQIAPLWELLGFLTVRLKERDHWRSASIWDICTGFTYTTKHLFWDLHPSGAAAEGQVGNFRAPWTALDDSVEQPELLPSSMNSPCHLAFTVRIQPQKIEGHAYEANGAATATSHPSPQQLMRLSWQVWTGPQCCWSRNEVQWIHHHCLHI